MNRFFTLLLAASCLTAVGQECVDDIYPPIFTGELVIPEGLEEDSYEIAEITLTYAAVNLHLSSETINFFDIEDPEWFMPIYEDNCTDNLDLSWQQYPLSGGCVGMAVRRYSFSDSNSNQTGYFDVYIQLYDDENPYVIQGPSDLTLDCGNSLYYQEALDWFESGGGIVAVDSVASFLEGSVFEYGPLNIAAQYDVSAILSGQPTTVEISWQVTDQCGNMALATSLLTLECGVVVEGCMDEMACNYSPSATEEDASCLYLDDCLVCGGDNSSCTGCLDSQACNYNDTIGIISQPESCDYSCCPGPGCCLDGQHWDWDLNGCVVTTPSDSNFDGCVQLNDLLDLLSAYGDCAAEESAWQCGDPLEYQGDDYETVLIGEQCWFAENLRSNYYSDGSLVESTQNNSSWANGNVGMICTYGNVAFNEDLYGSLYNWYAVADVRGLCPTGWHVPEEVEWQNLMDSAGGAGVAGEILKSQDFWANGSQGNDALGFDGRPGGYRRYNGSYQTLGSKGYWWTSTAVNDGQATIFELNSTAAVATYPDLINGGFSVRCIKD